MPTSLPAETFCVYLAQQLIAKRGFLPGSFPEAAPIAAQADIMLRFSDGYSLVLVALIDRETNPEKHFTLTAAEIKSIGEACQKYAGRINRRRMPMAIQLMEVGPASAGQQTRLGPIGNSFFSKNLTSAWVVDTASASVWTTEGFRGRSMRNFISKLLRSPREHVVADASVAAAERSFPHLTAAIITLLTAVFAAEIFYGIGGWDVMLKPKIATLLAFGGLTRSLVLAGEWYRLFAAPLLHGDVTHLVMNGVALGMAGYVLEPLIGRAWFAALFVIGALCGSLASIALSSGNIVSVGASGAVMALFAGMLMVSRRFPPGGTRMGLQMNAIYVLIPSLLPLASALKGVRVDYAAHFGGAFAGVAVGLLIVTLWPRAVALPRLRAAALAVAIAGLAGAAYAATPVRQNYATYEFGTVLMPQGLFPSTDAAARAQSADLVARYPRDPRARLIRATVLMQTKDLPGAERELRAGLAEENVWQRVFPGDLSARAHTLLAVVLLESKRTDEAKSVAKSACASAVTGSIRAVLDQQKLCAN